MKERYQVLCVDDNENNLFTLSVLLQKLENVEVLTAKSGQDALKVLLKNSIDLVLLDIQMPEMDGFEVARLIKLNKTTKKIPILFLTAVYKSEEFIAQGYELGAVDYLTKPIDDNQLLNKINLYLAIFKQRDQMEREQNRFMHLANSITEGIYVLDSEFKVIYINPKATDLLGYQEQELLGKEIHDMIHYHNLNGEEIPKEECPAYKALDSRQAYMSENEVLIRKDGSTFPVSIAAAPIQETQQDYSVVVIFKDLTHIKEREFQAKQMLQLEKQRQNEHEAVINSLVKMIDQRDSYTAGHTQRVAHYCKLIAREMRYSNEEIEDIEKAAKLHDIGKIATPDTILLKPGRLNELEYTLIKEHLLSGYNILKDIPSYSRIAEIMLYHHERFDGKGYPQGVKGYDIPPLSRIMIVADAFDAMTTNRIYKSKMSPQDAIEELKSLSNTQFHPEVVEAAQSVFSKISIQTDATQEPRTVLEKERLSYFFKDRLTGLYFYDYLSVRLREHFEGKRKYFMFVKLQYFSKYNRKFGWNKGDEFLQDIASYLFKHFDNESSIFRVHGDDFLVVSTKELDFDAEFMVKHFKLKSEIVNLGFDFFESDQEDQDLIQKINDNIL